MTQELGLPWYHCLGCERRFVVAVEPDQPVALIARCPFCGADRLNRRVLEPEALVSFE